MSNVDINVDRRTDGLTDGLTDGRTENRTPISHPATSRCDKNEVVISQTTFSPSYIYCIRPNYRTVRLDFQTYRTHSFVVKYVSIY